MTRVLALMPCLGRLGRTLALVPRLLATAGTSDWRLLLISDGDRVLAEALQRDLSPLGVDVRLLVSSNGQPSGYWRCLQSGARLLPEPPLLLNLANDLLPGRSWLQRALAVYDERPLDRLIGFNDGVHAGQHAAHFLVARHLLQDWYGEALYPTQYQHNFGDTELVARAKAAGLFAVAPFAVLYHDHPVTGAGTDEVYQLGIQSWPADQRTFAERARA